MLDKDRFTTTSSKSSTKGLIKTLEEFLDNIRYLQEAWDAPRLWYRGVSKSTYGLIPSIYRTITWSYNPVTATDMFNAFIRQGQAIIPSGQRSKWHWYHIMQHHGLPTRLLDWTDGALIALYFALRDSVYSGTPCVWVLNPFWLNLTSTGSGLIFDTDDLIQTDEDVIVNDYLEDHSDLPDLPVAVMPPHINERIVAQKSVFTVHGRLHNGLHAVGKQNEKRELVQLRISNAAAADLKWRLVTGGLTETTLFPDLEALAREIRSEYIR